MQHEQVCRTNLTPVSYLRRSAYIYPDKTAVVHGDRRYSYRHFEERVNRLAARLRTDGLQKHDRVAFLCPNIPPMLEAHFAVPAAGGILVAINTRLHAEEVGYILQHCGTRWLFFDHEFAPLIAALDTSGLSLVRIDDMGAAGDPYEDFIAGGSPAPVASWLEDEEETISINYTSGTTGRPKGVMYTYRGAYLNALGQVIEMGLSSDSVYLWSLPMFHCNGWCFPWAVTMVAGTHVCLRRVDPVQMWQLFGDEGVTHYCGAATGPAGDGLHRRCPTVAYAAGAAQSPELPPDPCVRPDRDLRPHHELRLAPRMGRQARRGAGAPARASRPGAGHR
jgi:fatty-acyl-CoA synthase